MHPPLPPVREILASWGARSTDSLEDCRRVMTSSCHACAAIPKISGAGEVDYSADWPVQTMHNGIKIAVGSKDGPWMTESIRLLGGHLQPLPEKCFHEVLEALGHACRMVEWGASWAYYSLWFQKRFAGAQTLIVDHDPNHLAIARYNFGLNGMEGEFIQTAVEGENGPEHAFDGGSEGAATPAGIISIDGLLQTRGPVDIFLADSDDADPLLLLQGMSQSITAGRIRVLFLPTSRPSSTGTPGIHGQCLDWLGSHGARLILEQAAGESASGHGLIVASFDPSLRLTVETGPCLTGEPQARPSLRGPEAGGPAVPSGTPATDLTKSESGPATAGIPLREGFISYAQHGEDVLLWRALREVQAGFYIDVGAYHPTADSVTRSFYDRGWRGINIEPVARQAAAFHKDRPRDITLSVAACSQTGSRVFYEIPGSGLSTFDFESIGNARNAGQTVQEHLVPTTTLAEICRQHVTGEIHFLKVDAEQSEREVLEGADFRTFRPWIVLVEATLPNSNEPSHGAWESILLEAAYVFLFFDGLNRYYASAEKADGLRQHFNRPVNPNDGYRTYREMEWERMRQTSTHVEREAKISSLSLEKKDLKTKLAELTEVHAMARTELKELRHKLRHHAANPKRALQLWWNR